MVSLMSLVVPIVLSAVLVFVLSSVIHMVMTYHRADFKGLPKEDEVLETFRRLNVAPGDYSAPFCDSPASMKEPAYVENMKRGPGLVVTVWPTSSFNMGATLGQWFVYLLVVSLFTGYVLSRVFGEGANYMEVFRIAGTVAFMVAARRVVCQQVLRRGSPCENLMAKRSPRMHQMQGRPGLGGELHGCAGHTHTQLVARRILRLGIHGGDDHPLLFSAARRDKPDGTRTPPQHLAVDRPGRNRRGAMHPV